MAVKKRKKSRFEFLIKKIPAQNATEAGNAIYGS